MDAPQGFNPYRGLSQETLDQTILEIANTDDLDKITLLVEAGANVNTKNPGDGWTPLMVAAVKGRINIVKALVKNHADVNMENDSGRTPIMLAALSNHLEVVDFLIQNKAKIDKADQGNYTALKWAITGFCEKVTYRLLCELNFEQRKELTVKKNISENIDKVVDNFNKKLHENKTKVYQIAMPFLLKMDGAHGYDELPPELLSIISGFLFKSQDIAQWYPKNRIEQDVREACYFVIGKNKKDREYCLIDEKAPKPPLTPLRDSKKRKAEDELEENGRNKKMRVETQDEQEQEQEMNTESSYFSFSNYCTLQ